jgi:phosphoenolpyruvate phosphomutase
MNSHSVRLRELIAEPKLAFAMEAHSAIAAKIVEMSGFDAIWASGFSISSAFGLHDRSEISFTQLTDIIETMVEASSLPVLADVDSGFGDFNNLRLLAKRLSRIGAAGACVEDKPFPKLNSFADGRQALSPVADFCGKIAAAKDALLNDDFVLVARTEALIVGAGMREALRRAESYRLAGADAILIHSKRSTASEVLAFSREWAGRCPLVIVPTTYAKTPTSLFESTGISLLIWANQMFRASVHAMLAVCRDVARNRSLKGVSHQLVSMDEIFDMLDYASLASDEKAYSGDPALSVLESG